MAPRIFQFDKMRNKLIFILQIIILLIIVQVRCLIFLYWFILLTKNPKLRHKKLKEVFVKMSLRCLLSVFQMSYLSILDMYVVWNYWDYFLWNWSKKSTPIIWNRKKILSRMFICCINMYINIYIFLTCIRACIIYATHRRTWIYFPSVKMKFRMYGQMFPYYCVTFFVLSYKIILSDLFQDANIICVMWQRAIEI